MLVRNEALHHISPEELEPLVKKVRAINENPHKRSLPPFPVAAHRDYELVYCGPRTIDGVRMPFLAVRQRRVGELSVGLVSEKPLAPGRKAKLFLPNGSSNPRVFVVLNRTRKALQPGTLRQVIERDNVAGLTRRTLKDKGGRVSGFEVLPLRYPRKFG